MNLLRRRSQLWLPESAGEIVTPPGSIPAPPAAPTEPNTHDYTVTPGTDLDTFVAGKPGGSSYLIQNGTYTTTLNTVAKQGDQFWGESRDGVIFDGSAFGAQTAASVSSDDRTAFKGSADDVTVTRMTIRNYGNGTASTLQEQAGIMCKGKHWDNGLTAQSTGWRIHNVHLTGNGNSGITMGHETVVTSCEVDNHDVTGIHAAYVAGGLIQGCNLYRNAKNPSSGAGDNGGCLKLVNINQVGSLIAMPPQKTFSVIDNDLTDNYPTVGNGRPIWFDIDCHAGYVAHNRITETTGGLFGIMWELSNGGIAEYNVITGAIGYAGWNGSNFQNGALSASESHNIIYRHNTVTNANVAFMNRLSARGTADGAPGDSYPDQLFTRGELANSHAAISDPNQLSNIGCSNNSLIENTFVNCGAFGDNLGANHAQYSQHATHTYLNNSVGGATHYNNGVAAAFPGGGRS